MHTPENSAVPIYSIGTVARMLSVSVQTLRMYEREGLFVPYKSSTNQRWYSNADVDRIRCIRQAINEQKIGIEGIKRIQSLIPCWAIIGCSETDRQRCEAYQGHERGCWTYRHPNNICAGRDCRTCEVYLAASNCEQIKSAIVDASKTRLTVVGTNVA